VQYSPQRSKAGEAPQWVADWQKEKVLGKEALLDFQVLPAAQTAYHAGVAVLLSSKKDGRVFSIANGQQLATFEPNSLGNHRLAVSGNGRFIAVASFTAEVKVSCFLIVHRFLPVLRQQRLRQRSSSSSSSCCKHAAAAGAHARWHHPITNTLHHG
jgi:hypothetical protein